jgi:hypothetical protein
MSSVGLVFTFEYTSRSWCQGLLFCFVFHTRPGTGIGYFKKLSYQSGPGMGSKTDFWLV